MKKILLSLAVLGTLFLIFFSRPRTSKGGSREDVIAKQSSSDACTPPSQVASTTEETAWRLFVAATCPVNNDKYPFVTWENWIEQNQLYTPSGTVMALAVGERPRFHMSPLARFLQEQKKKTHRIEPQLLLPEATTQDCNSDTWSKRTICEEARLNPESEPTNPSFSLGGPLAIPAGYARRDFVWSLSLAH